MFAVISDTFRVFRIVKFIPSCNTSMVFVLIIITICHSWLNWYSVRRLSFVGSPVFSNASAAGRWWHLHVTNSYSIQIAVINIDELISDIVWCKNCGAIDRFALHGLQFRNNTSVHALSLGNGVIIPSIILINSMSARARVCVCVRLHKYNGNDSSQLNSIQSGGQIHRIHCVCVLWTTHTVVINTYMQDSLDARPTMDMDGALVEHPKPLALSTQNTYLFDCVLANGECACKWETVRILAGS